MVLYTIEEMTNKLETNSIVTIQTDQKNRKKKIEMKMNKTLICNEPVSSSQTYIWNPRVE